MRFALQVLVLAALTTFLALLIPKKALFPKRTGAGAFIPPPEVSYVELDEEAYASRIKLAKMAWQVRARAAGQLDLEDDTPLAWEPPPPPPPSHGFPAAPKIPPVTAEPAGGNPLAPPTVAAPPAEVLPAPDDRRHDALLDLSPYESLSD